MYAKCLSLNVLSNVGLLRVPYIIVMSSIDLPTTQWAAVNIWLLLIIEPPQKLQFPNRNLILLDLLKFFIKNPYPIGYICLIHLLPTLAIDVDDFWLLHHFLVPS